MAPLQFTPLSSSLSPGFWHTLTDLKLHHLGLDDAPLQLRVDYTTGRTVLDNKSDQSTVGIDGRVQFGEGSILYDTGQDRSVLRWGRTRPVGTWRAVQHCSEVARSLARRIQSQLNVPSRVLSSSLSAAAPHRLNLTEPRLLR